MHNKFSSEDKQRLIIRYQKGESVASLCLETGVPRSTFYSWIKAYQFSTTDTGQVVTPKAFEVLSRLIEKLVAIVEVLKSADCKLSDPLKVKLNAIEQLRGQFSIHTLCEAMDVPRSTFYNHILHNKRDQSTYAQNRALLRDLIKEAYDESSGQLFGAAKIKAVLSTQGYRVSEKLVSELMREMGLYSISPTSKKEYKHINSPAKKGNLLNRHFDPKAPNQVWASDVTCFKDQDKYYYICVIIDLFSRKVIAHRVATKNSTQLITFTFKQAYADRSPEGSLIFHSDCGSQYAAFAFQKLLCKNEVIQSFSNPGQPYDNAVVESFFSFMKKEELYRRIYRSEPDLLTAIDRYINFYNNKRPHGTLNYKTPEQAEQCFAADSN